MLAKLRQSRARRQLTRAIGDFQLPAFPAVAQQVLAVARSQDASARTVADAAAQDPGLSAAVLRNVNSAAFGARKHVEDVRQAVALLGVAAVESLVVSIAVSGSLPAYADPGQWRSFWHASVRRAAAARAVAAHIEPQSASRAYTAALLSEMAVPFLVRAHPAVYTELLEHWDRGGAELHQLERDRLGWDHAEVASWICEEWGLPEALTRSIGAHHEPIGGTRDTTRWVAAIRQDGEVPDAMVAAAREHLGLEPEVTARLLAESFESADRLARDLFQ